MSAETHADAPFNTKITKIKHLVSARSVDEKALNESLIAFNKAGEDLVIDRDNKQKLQESLKQLTDPLVDELFSRLTYDQQIMLTKKMMAIEAYNCDLQGMFLCRPTLAASMTKKLAAISIKKQGNNENIPDWLTDGINNLRVFSPICCKLWYSDEGQHFVRNLSKLCSFDTGGLFKAYQEKIKSNKATKESICDADHSIAVLKAALDGNPQKKQDNNADVSVRSKETSPVLIKKPEEPKNHLFSFAFFPAARVAREGLKQGASGAFVTAVQEGVELIKKLWK